MELSRVQIQNFRSIENTGWVDIHEDITTLLGANESGKTSFLEAINHVNKGRKYDKEDVKYPDHMSNRFPIPVVNLNLVLSESEKDMFERKTGENIQNITVRKMSDGTICIYTSTEQENFSLIKGVVNKGFVHSILESLKEFLNEELKDNKNPEVADKAEELSTKINQCLNSDDFSTESFQELGKELKNLSFELSTAPERNSITSAEIVLRQEAENFTKNNTTADDLVDHLPNFIYHDSANLLSDQIHINNLNSDDHRPFRNLLEICDIDYDEFQNKSVREQVKATEGIETTIEGRVNNLWEQKEVDITVSYNSDKFVVLLQDEEINGSSGINRDLVAPSQRSRGFQWFFSFYINLRASASERSRNTIMLLDDPAVFLHPKGKRNWLDAIEEIADGNQVLYTSHSPYLIRKQFPSRIRIVEDRDGEGTIISDDFLESDEMSLEPLRKALGIGLGDSPFAAKRKILVEGPSDYYILTGLANYFKEYLDRDIINWEEVTIFPVGGADNMVQASKWVMSENFSYAILLDNDGKGNNVMERLQDEAPAVEQERVFQLERNDNHQNFHIEIEDMFRTEFYIDCLNTAYKAEISDFEPIEIYGSEDGEGISIEGETYKQRKIASKLNTVLENRDHGELDKSLVAREIQDRLAGGDADEEDVEQFNFVMDKLRRTMPR
jgi:predicted ATP-dependent endonuclease of OLD family